MKLPSLLVFLLVAVAHTSADIYDDCTHCSSQELFWCPSPPSCGNGLQKCDVIPIDAWVNCPLPPNPKTVYNDSFTRNVVAAHVSAAYASDAGASCFKNVLPTTVISKSIRVKCDQGFPVQDVYCQANTAYDPVSRAIIITFIGPDPLQVTDDQWTAMALNRTYFLSQGNVVTYFYNSFYSLWNGGLQQELSTLQFEHSGYELWVFGHSIGGALASLQANFAVKQGLISSDKLKLITFAETRSFQYPIAEAMEFSVPYSFRVIHQHDIVPHRPKKVSTPSDDGLWHRRVEVWYKTDAMAVGDEFVVCQEDDGPYCSNMAKNVDRNINDFYFHPLKTWAQGGCN